MDIRLCNRLSSGDFLNLDGPTGMAEPWESKECFFERLGLNERRRSHRRIFRQMLREAIVGRTIVLRSKVASAAQRDSNEEDMIVPEQVHDDATRAIYDAASPQSKAIYDLVTDQDDYCWILPWTLRWALRTHCETCLDGPRTPVWSPVTTPRTTEPDRINSASPAEHVLSPQKRKLPSDAYQSDSEDTVKRQKIEEDVLPSLSGHPACRTSPMSPSTREESRPDVDISRLPHTSARHIHPGPSKTTSTDSPAGSPHSSPRTPISLSSLLNPQHSI